MLVNLLCADEEEARLSCMASGWREVKKLKPIRERRNLWQKTILIKQQIFVASMY